MRISLSFRSINLLGGLILHGLLSIVLFAFLILVFYLSWPSKIESSRIDVDHVLTHLRGLKESLHHQRAMERMQRIFPEGACFTVTLYGLAWANLATHLEGEARTEAIGEIEYALERQVSREAVRSFMDTQVRRGVFWLGQRNLLVGKYLALLDKENRPRELLEEFKTNSADLVMQYLISPTRHLDSYPGMCWPTDNMAAFASLHIHDDIHGTDYYTLYDEWKDWTLDHMDPKSEMPAGELNSKTGDLYQPARGCANSWMIAILSQSDPEFSRVLYDRYLDTFGIQHLGFRMFREWPTGMDHLGGDIDSGPVIWQAGVSATGIGLAAARSQGDRETEADIRDLTRLFGWPRHRTNDGNGAVDYLFGQLPVGDAFLAWGYSIERPEEALSEIPSVLDRFSDRWFWMVLIVLVVLLVPIQGIFFVRRSWRKWRRLSVHQD